MNSPKGKHNFHASSRHVKILSPLGLSSNSSLLEGFFIFGLKKIPYSRFFHNFLAIELKHSTILPQLLDYYPQNLSSFLQELNLVL